jgi:hypothetical protein
MKVWRNRSCRVGGPSSSPPGSYCVTASTEVPIPNFCARASLAHTFTTHQHGARDIRSAQKNIALSSMGQYDRCHISYQGTKCALNQRKVHTDRRHQGVIFFVGHPYLYPLLRARLIPAVLLSAFVLLNLFFWTFLPQVAFLALFHRAGSSAWVNGTFLVLGEGAAVVAILFESFLVDESQVDVFDAVLVHKGYEDLIRPFRPVSEDSLNDPVRRLGKPTRSSVYGPFSFRQIAEFVILLPLNFVPYVGVPLFLLLTGYRAGPLQHWRYFKLREFDKKQRNAYIKKKRWEYTW